jgi:hypothetical protein
MNCPRNLYNLSKDYFNHRTAILTTNNYTIERKITKGTPQGSCCSLTYWNILFDSLLTVELTSHSKAIAYADDNNSDERRDNSRGRKLQKYRTAKNTGLGSKQQIEIQQ